MQLMLRVSFFDDRLSSSSSVSSYLSDLPLSLSSGGFLSLPCFSQTPNSAISRWFPRCSLWAFVNFEWYGLCTGGKSNTLWAFLCQMFRKKFRPFEKGLSLMLWRMLLMIVCRSVYCLNLSGADLSFRPLMSFRREDRGELLQSSLFRSSFLLWPDKEYSFWFCHPS